MSKILTLPCLGLDLGYHSTKFTLPGLNSAHPSKIRVQSFLSVVHKVPRKGVDLTEFRAASYITVDVDGQSYWVGKDAYLHTAGSSYIPLKVRDFPATESYKALVKGALYQIALDALAQEQAINDLVILTVIAGLPFSTLANHHGSVTDAILGEHVLPPLPGRSQPLRVNVKDCVVIPQPLGAQLANAMDVDSQDNNCLTLDIGGGTFDWLTCMEGVPVQEKCGAYERGMRACIFNICDSKHPGWRQSQVTIQRLHEALFKGRDMVSVGGQEFPVAPFLPVVDAVLDECLEVMLDQLGNTADIDRILITGGGAQHLQRVLFQKMPEWKNITTMDREPEFSNVRGFHCFGYELAKA